MANLSYKTKYTELLKQHLALIGHLNEALSERSELMTELNDAIERNENLQEQVTKLQAAAIKHIEAAQGQKELAKPAVKPTK